MVRREGSGGEAVRGWWRCYDRGVVALIEVRDRGGGKGKDMGRWGGHE